MQGGNIGSSVKSWDLSRNFVVLCEYKIIFYLLFHFYLDTDTYDNI